MPLLTAAAFIALATGACAPSPVLRGSEASSWKVSLLTSGGIRGQVSQLEVLSEGTLERRERDVIVCAETVAPPVLASVGAAVKAARPDQWQKRYATYGGKGAADMITSTLVLTRQVENAPAQETTVTWAEGEPKLPEDLRGLVEALAPLNASTAGCSQ